MIHIKYWTQLNILENFKLYILIHVMVLTWVYIRVIFWPSKQKYVYLTTLSSLITSGQSTLILQKVITLRQRLRHDVNLNNAPYKWLGNDELYSVVYQAQDWSCSLYKAVYFFSTTGINFQLGLPRIIRWGSSWGQKIFYPWTPFCHWAKWPPPSLRRETQMSLLPSFRHWWAEAIALAYLL